MTRYVAVPLLLLAACASTATKKAELQQSLDRRIGKPVEALVEEVGAPTRSVPKGPPGEFLYVYEWVSAGFDCAVTYTIKGGAVSAVSQNMKSGHCY